MRRVLLPAAAGLLALSALTVQVPGKPADPMPPPTPTPAPHVSPNVPAGPGVVKATRVEVVDASGRVAAVLTSEGSVPIAIVNDNGTARKIDLAKVARLVK